MKAEKQPRDRLPRPLFQATSTRNIISFTLTSKQIYSIKSGHSTERRILERDTWNRVFPKRVFLGTCMMKLDQSCNLYTINFTVQINVAKGKSGIFQ